MFKNHLRIALRNFRKKKSFTLINILGLTVGMTVSLLILTYARYELSYDQFHSNAKDIYRVSVDIYNGGALQVQDAQCYPAVGGMAIENFPEIEDYAMARHIGRILIKNGDISFNEDGVLFANPGWLNVFDWNMLQGDRETALNNPEMVAISQSTAKKYFGEEDPMGKMLTFIPGGSQLELMVNGVFEDVPSNVHLGFDILISYETAVKNLGWKYENWSGNNEYMYLLSNKQNLLETDFVDRFNEEFRKHDEDYWNEGLAVQPLTDIHLKSNKTYEAEVNGNYQMVNILLAVAAFVLVIAWVNYINLATANALDRGKEVGVRKVLGSSKAALVKQFLTESFLINFFSLVLTITCIQGVLPIFNEISGVELQFNVFSDSNLISQLIALFLIGSLAAGIYPSFVLSNYQPLKVLTGKFKDSRGGLLLRKGLVTFQFTMTMLLLIGTVVIYKQVNHMRSQELGINIDQTIVIKSPIVLGSNEEQEQKRRSLKTEFNRISEVDMVSFSQTLFGQGTIDMSTTGMENVETAAGKGNTFYYYQADANFFTAFEFDVLAGRSFDENLERLFDSTRYMYQGVMINETSRKLFGFETNEDAIGKKIERWNRNYTVVGVLKDYNHHSLKSAVDPTVIFFDKYGNNAEYISIKVNSSVESGGGGGGSYNKILSDIRQSYDKVYPLSDFDYYFLDEQFNEQYKADQQFGQVFSTFAGFAIFISILGLFGLVLFEIQQRMKEIGVRKVLGASPIEIVKLFSKNFMKLIGISILTAIPISYFGIQQWLDSYASRISVGWSIFLIPAIVLAFIALITIAFQSLKAANQNPVKSLRYE